MSVDEELDFVVTLPRVPVVHGRVESILAKAKGRSVLHVGCVDAGLLSERFLRGELLHSQLAAVSERLYGIDIDDAGLEFLRAHGFPDVARVDVSEAGWSGQLTCPPYDLVIASEVVEHLANPGIFLSELRDLATANGADLLFTVPNAFNVATLHRMLHGEELVHPDHNYWFSYRTFTTLLKKHALAPVEILSYSFEESGWGGGASRRHASGGAFSVTGVRAKLGSIRPMGRRLLVSWLHRRSPFWCDGLIVTARPIK